MNVTINFSRVSLVFLLTICSLHHSLTNVTVGISELSLRHCRRCRGITLVRHLYERRGSGWRLNVITKYTVYKRKIHVQMLTLNAQIATKVVCFSGRLRCLRSLYGKQCGPRSDCSYRSSLFWVHVVCFYT